MRLFAPRDQAGFSLASAVVAGFLLGVLAAIAVYSIIASQKALGQGTTATAVDLEVSKILGHMVPELIVTGIDDAGDPNDSNMTTNSALCTDPTAVMPGDVPNCYLRFRKNTGASYDAGTGAMRSSWSPDIEYWFEYASPANGYAGPAETSQGGDRNGNGLEGEGVIRRRQNGKTVTIGRNVLARSFALVVDEANSAVTLAFEVGGVLPDGSHFTRRATERIRLRN
jgi:hypothetical protein